MVDREAFATSVRLRTALVVLVTLGALASTDAAGTPGVSVAAPAVRQAYADATLAAGLGGFLHAGFLGNATADPAFIETMGPGICWLDVDTDGRLDLFLVNGRYLTHADKEATLAPTSRLYRNLGDGTFADVTSSAGVGLRAWGQGCSAADYDNDGDADLFVAAFGGDTLYRNDGGTFTNVTATLGLANADCAPYPCWSAAGTWLDADRDGCLDLYISRYGNWTLDQGPPNDPDHAPEQRDQYLRGACGAAFVDKTDAAGFHTWGNTWSAVAYDVDGDGWSDLYVSNDQDLNELWINDGDGTFTLSPHAADPRAGMGTAVGDLDGNGLPDLVTTNFVNEDNGVWLQQANGSFVDGGGEYPFTDARPYSGWATFIHDVDHDGRNDLTVAYGMTQETGVIPTAEPVHVFHQTPAGGFEQWNRTLGAPTSGNYVARGAAWADYDDDGDLDMALGEAGENPTHLWRMDRPTGNFLTLTLESLTPGVNRDAEGARVTVSAAGIPTFTTEKRAQQGYLSSNDPRVHLGLADAREANLTIRWPDGATQDVANVPANAFVKLVQGESLQILRRLPLADATGPAEVVRLVNASFSANLDVAITRAEWDFGDGAYAVCEDGLCRDANDTPVGTMAGTTATLTHAFARVGDYDVAVALTDAAGHTLAKRIRGEVTGRLTGALTFASPEFDIDEPARGLARVAYEDGTRVAGAQVSVAIRYSFWPTAEDVLLPLTPAGVRTLAGYRTLTLQGTTNATGEWSFEVPLWWQSPIPAASAVRFNPIGDYHATLSGSYRSATFDGVNASYQVFV